MRFSRYSICARFLAALLIAAFGFSPVPARDRGGQALAAGNGSASSSASRALRPEFDRSGLEEKLSFVRPEPVEGQSARSGLEEQERPVAQRWSEQESIEKRNGILSFLNQEGTLSDSSGYNNSLKVYSYAGGAKRSDLTATYGAEKWVLPLTRSGFPAYPNERAVFVRVGALFFMDLDEFNFLEGNRREAIRKILGGNMLLIPGLQASTVATLFDRQKDIFGIYTYATIAAMLETERFPERMVIAGVVDGDLLLALGALGVRYLEGFDLREDVVMRAKRKLEANGFKNINVFTGDLTRPQQVASQLIFPGRETGFVGNIGTWPGLYYVTNQDLIPLIKEVSRESQVTLFFGAGYLIGQEKTDVPVAVLEDQPIFQGEGFSPALLATSFGFGNGYPVTWTATRNVDPAASPQRAGLEEPENWQDPYRSATFVLQQGRPSISTVRYRDYLRDRLLVDLGILYHRQPLRDFDDNVIPWNHVVQNLRPMVDGLVRAEPATYAFLVQEGSLPADPGLYANIQYQFGLEDEQVRRLAVHLYALMREYAQLKPLFGFHRATVANIRSEGLRRLFPLEWFRTFAEQRTITLSRAWGHIRSHWNNPEGSWPIDGDPSAGLEETLSAGLEENEETRKRLELEAYLQGPFVSWRTLNRARLLTGDSWAYDGFVKSLYPHEMIPDLRGGLSPLADRINGENSAGWSWIDGAGGFGAALQEARQRYGNRMHPVLIDAMEWKRDDLTPNARALLHARAREKEIRLSDIYSRKGLDFRRKDLRYTDLQVPAGYPLRLVTVFAGLRYTEDPLGILVHLYNQLPAGTTLLADLGIRMGHPSSEKLVRFYERIFQELRKHKVPVDLKVTDLSVENPEVSLALPVPEYALGMVLVKGKENLVLQLEPRPQDFVDMTTGIPLLHKVVGYRGDMKEPFRFIPAAGLEEMDMPAGPVGNSLDEEHIRSLETQRGV